MTSKDKNMKNKNLSSAYAYALMCCFIISGCASLKIQTQGAVPVTNKEGEYSRVKTVHMFFGTKKWLDEDEGFCDSAALASVEIKSNYFYSLISTVTLGIWKPIKVEYSCNEKCN